MTRVEDQRPSPPHFLISLQYLPFTLFRVLTVQLITVTPFRQGTAEVVFARRSDALAALKRYNNVQLDGKPMKIEVIGTNIEAPAPAIFTLNTPALGNFGFPSKRSLPHSCTASFSLKKKKMELLSPASPSLVVRSPRQTLSLLRNRHPHREHKPPTSSASGPKLSEVYGFVGSITTIIATAVFLVWAYTPEPCLRSLGITYYPAKYWALAVPSLVMVAVALSLLLYMGFNFLATPPPTSFNTFFDEYSRERSTSMFVSPATTQEADRPIEPISDISIHQINNLMFAH